MADVPAPWDHLEKLAEASKWYVLEETHARALAEVVNLQHRLSLAVVRRRGVPHRHSARHRPIAMCGHQPVRMFARAAMTITAWFAFYVALSRSTRAIWT